MKLRPDNRWLLALLFLFSCAKEYSHEGGPLSQDYLAKDDLDNCSLIKAEGIYKAGVNLTGSNFLLAPVHVGKPGRYVISSDSINGYSFSAAGSFTDTGTVQVKLAAKGKPVAAGNNLFTLTYHSSVCRVSVAVVKDTVIPVVSTNPDHFPLTDGSRWVYDDLTFPGYIITNAVLGDTVIGSLAYKRIDEYKSFYPATNRRYYTRSALSYFRYASVSGFTSAFNFSPSQYDDVIYLKEGLQTGDVWYSKTYSGRTTLSTQVKVLRYAVSHRQTPSL